MALARLRRWRATRAQKGINYAPTDDFVTNPSPLYTFNFFQKKTFRGLKPFMVKTFVFQKENISLLQKWAQKGVNSAPTDDFGTNPSPLYTFNFFQKNTFRGQKKILVKFFFQKKKSLLFLSQNILGRAQKGVNYAPTDDFGTNPSPLYTFNFFRKKQFQGQKLFLVQKKNSKIFLSGKCFKSGKLPLQKPPQNPDFLVNMHFWGLKHPSIPSGEYFHLFWNLHAEAKCPSLENRAIFRFLVHFLCRFP